MFVCTYFLRFYATNKISTSEYKRLLFVQTSFTHDQQLHEIEIEDD